MQNDVRCADSFGSRCRRAEPGAARLGGVGYDARRLAPDMTRPVPLREGTQVRVFFSTGLLPPLINMTYENTRTLPLSFIRLLFVWDLIPGAERPRSSSEAVDPHLIFGAARNPSGPPVKSAPRHSLGTPCGVRASAKERAQGTEQQPTDRAPNN